MSRELFPRIVALAVGFTLLASTQVFAAEIRVSGRLDLPDGVAYASDIRWRDDATVTVLVPRQGIVDIRIDGTVARRYPLQLPKFTDHLATSDDEVFVASINHTILRWQRRDGATRFATFPTISDLDVHGSDVVLLGLSWEQRKWSPDGAIAWIADTSANQFNWKPILKMSSRRQETNYVNCFLLQVGMLRAHPDGSIIIAPGSDEGIVRVTRDGRHLQEWRGALAPFDSPCRVSMVQAEPLARPAPRAEWSNSRRILDELVALTDGFGAIVRYSEREDSRWYFLRYHFDGRAPVRIDLPFRSSHHYARIRADSRNGRIAMLMVNRDWHKGDERLPAAIIVAELVE